MKNIICFLFGHKDWVMGGRGIIPQDELYRLWVEVDRDCERCGKPLGPKI